MRPAVIPGHATPQDHAAMIEQQHRRNIAELVRRMRISSSMWAIAEAHLERNQFEEARAVIAEAKSYL